MPSKIYPAVNALNSGELSELISGIREDLTKYRSGCRILENSMPLVEGGAKKMPGTYYGGPCLGKSRLVPFQFSTAQGAILEFSAGLVRIWEPTSQGSWALGLATTLPGSDFDPTMAYVEFDQVHVGACVAFTFAAGKLFITAPYGQSNATTVPITITVNSADTLTVAAFGTAPNQYILIKLANATPAKNAASLIQAAIQALGTVNSVGSNLVDVSAWTVTPDTVWYATPSIIGPTVLSLYMTTVNRSFACVAANQYDEFPITRFVRNTHTGTVSPIVNSAYWKLVDASVQVPIQIDTPYAEADLFDLDVGTQSADVLYITHPNYPPASINRLSAVQWTYTLLSLYGTEDVITTGYSALGQVITSITKANPAVVTVASGATPFTNGERIYINGCAGMVELNEGQYQVANLGGTSGAYTFNLLPLGASGTGPVAGLSGPTGAAFPDENPSGTYATTDGTGTDLTVIVEGDQPFHGPVWVISSITIGNPGTGYTVGDVVHFVVLGRTLEARVKAVTLSGLINSTGFLDYVGGGFVVAIPQLFNTPGNYPACVTLYQERLCFAGALATPTQMNGSVQGDYPDFIADPTEDDHAIQFTLVSKKVDQILNMIGTPNALLLGSAGGVWTMVGASGEALTQTSVQAAKQTAWGVSRIEPQMIGDYTIFVSRSARIAMMVVYNFVTNQWDNFDLTRLNRTITVGPSGAQSGIVQTAVQIEPYPIFWAVRADGQLIGLVFNQQDQVFAWFRVNMLPEGGIIESAAVITRDGEEDQLAVVVNRTINGVTQRYFEYFMPQELFGQLSNAFFVHCGQQWQGSGPFDIDAISNGNPCTVTAPGHNFTNGMTVQISGVKGMANPSGDQSINQEKTEAYTVAGVSGDSFQLAGMDTSLWSAYGGGGTVMQVTNQVTGMSYLMGQNVVAVGDEALILGPTPVTDDAVNFDYYCNLITIGIPYQITTQPTNPVLSSPSATTRGQKQTLKRVTLSLYESMGGKIGTDAKHMYPIVYGSGSLGKGPGLFTGEVTRDLDADWEDHSTFIITQSEPFPFTLRGLVLRMSYNPD